MTYNTIFFDIKIKEKRKKVMETWSKIVMTIVISVLVRWGWKVVNWVWLKPKKLEKWLRNEGYKGNPYKLITGDMKDLATMMKEAKSKPIPITTHDINSYILPFDHHIVTKYGEKSFVWFGPHPRVYIRDPELIKEVLSKPNDFQKPPEPLRDSIFGGLLVAEGHKWTKHRKIIDPAFNLQNLKIMFLAIYSSCSDMVQKWELLTAGNESTELDVWPDINNLSGEVISRTAFGSSYKEGMKIFRINREQINLVFQMLFIIHLPGRRFIPTKTNKKFQRNVHELRLALKGIIDKRKKAIEMGEHIRDDLLGILLESNSKEIEENGVGMSMEDVIEECKLFYMAGSETTSNWIVWTMICLSLHQEWQVKAREEILQVFGKGELDFEGLKDLKISTMILYEVIRLYPPAIMYVRTTLKDTKLGNMMIPPGVQLALAPIHVHHDPKIWGKDATEFKPERFSEGVVNATNGKGANSFLPFGGGPRVCIGQNFAMTEARTALAKILQRFSFELSPSYKHSPFPVFTLPPQFGAPLIIRNI